MMEKTQAIPFDNQYAALPSRFYEKQAPQPVRAPQLIRANRDLVALLGIDADWMTSEAATQVFSGNAVADGSEPLAQAYAGHQFGNWVPQLGDGRAVLLGEVIGKDGVRRDIQLKGAGRTPFSRGGDGRSPLGPALREYIMCEAMHHLGVPTTRALAVLSTGEQVMREEPLAGGIVVRVAQSHVRVGTFQYFYAREDYDALRTLTDFVIARHYPAIADADEKPLELLKAVSQRQAELIAQWLSLGFIHGVMNTDNMTLSGETIDYGPCAFLDAYHPATVFSSIDRQGRYAFGNQPQIGQWNLSNLAQTLLPLMGDDEDVSIAKARDGLAAFGTAFQSRYSALMRAKIGLELVEPSDGSLFQDLLKIMAEQQADFTRTFRALSLLGKEDSGSDEIFRREFIDPTRVDLFLIAWRQRLARETRSDEERQAAMKLVNPMIIPRNHLVEQAISAAYDGDYGPFHALIDALKTPYEDRDFDDLYALSPGPDEAVQRTFCGT